MYNTLDRFRQIKTMLDEFLEKLPDEFNMVELTTKIPVEERTPYVTVALQETERMNGLTNEIRRTLKELNLGLKVRETYGIVFVDKLKLNDDSCYHITMRLYKCTLHCYVC